MIRYLSLAEVLNLHDRIISETGGSSHGLRDLGMLESALGQPKQTFGGHDLYPGLVEKATARTFSLIKNHPFVDGNKRVGHAAVEAMLMLNGKKLDKCLLLTARSPRLAPCARAVRLEPQHKRETLVGSYWIRSLGSIRSSSGGSIVTCRKSG